MRTPVVKILKKKSYLAMIRNAVRGEVHMFRNLYALVNGTERDILKNGELSCAAFISGVLTLNGLIDRPHATVDGTEKAIRVGGWVEVEKPQEGAVLAWEGIRYEDGQVHRHMGFFVGNDRAVSNASNAEGVPREHHWTYDGTRKVDRIWWHPALDE